MHIIANDIAEGDYRDRCKDVQSVAKSSGP